MLIKKKCFGVWLLWSNIVIALIFTVQAIVLGDEYNVKDNREESQAKFCGVTEY